MTGRERFLTAMNGEKPDRIPVFDFLEGKRIFEEVLGITIDLPNGDEVARCSLGLGFDGIFIGYGGFSGTDEVGFNSGESSAGVYKDEWGVCYKSTGVSWPWDSPCDHPIDTREDFEKWKTTAPDPGRDDRLTDIRGAMGEAGGEAAVMGGIVGPLTTATFLLGFTGTCFKLIDEPDFVEEIFKVSNDFYIPAIDRMIEAGVDAICICEDLGYKTGTFASPKIYRKHLFPYVAELIDCSKKRAVPVFFHCDGNVNEILDDLVGLGIDVLHPLERKSNMNIGNIRKRYGTRLCLAGNIDASDTLPNGPLERIDREVRETIDCAGREGAFILASDSDYHDGIPPENFIAMIEAGKKYGKYPIAL
jgi:uroporphyrinogen decarboxylase